MDKALSIRENIDLHIMDNESFIDLRMSKVWLEGWICGATDNMLHSEMKDLKDESMEYLNEEYRKKKASL